MTIMEQVEFIEMLRKLPEEKRKEFYYMIKGAVFVIENVEIA